MIGMFSRYVFVGTALVRCCARDGWCFTAVRKTEFRTTASGKSVWCVSPTGVCCCGNCASRRAATMARLASTCTASTARTGGFRANRLRGRLACWASGHPDRGSTRFLVERYQRLAIGLANRMPFDLERGRHLSVSGGKGVARDNEVAHALDLREIGVDAGDRGADCLEEIAVRMKTREIGFDPALAREALEEFPARNDHRHQKRSAVAKHHRLGDFGLEREKALDPSRRHHVAAGILDEVALAVGDLDVAVRIEAADIAGVQPAILYRARGRFGVVPVSL